MSSLRIGKVFVTNNYGECKVIDRTSNRWVIEFLHTGYKTETKESFLLKGQIKDPYFPNVEGIGYIGVGKYKKNTHLNLYTLWHRMLTRCYSGRNPSYKNCRVSKRWHNFQTFCEDITQMPNWDTPGFELDKDLRVLGNKIYGRKYCSFVPHIVNSAVLLTRVFNKKLPIGVKRDGKKFTAKLNKYNKEVYLGRKNNVEDAHLMYIKARSNYIKELLETYIDFLHEDVVVNVVKLAG